MFPTRVSDVPPASLRRSIAAAVVLEEFISDALGREIVRK